MSGVNYVKKKPKKPAAKGAASGGKGAPQSSGRHTGGKDEKDLLPVMPEDDINRRLGPYQLMEAIGRGGFGVVYRGLNIETGLTVAIKRVTLIGTPKDELENIEGEIRLLQNLKHPNIVQYVDALRSPDYLNIVLEYMESGALSGLLSKMGGKLPEKLTAIYTAQVLKGLQYLHLQGVIHRDIKGANILSTKEGLIKLADFGVATKLNENRKSDSVVGTPYWMAPEIIEMTGQQSSACDIWSVGCTVVELLTGKPPYFDLQQMPALFRIVQDEHPPLPEGISSALEDFLMQCFQKDPNRRIDAVGLLKHQWLKAAVLNLESREGSLSMSSSPMSVMAAAAAMPPPESKSPSKKAVTFPATAPAPAKVGEPPKTDVKNMFSRVVSTAMANNKKPLLSALPPVTPKKESAGAGKAVPKVTLDIDMDDLDDLGDDFEPTPATGAAGAKKGIVAAPPKRAPAKTLTSNIAADMDALDDLDDFPTGPGAAAQRSGTLGKAVVSAATTNMMAPGQAEKQLAKFREKEDTDTPDDVEIDDFNFTKLTDNNKKGGASSAPSTALDDAFMDDMDDVFDKLDFQDSEKDKANDEDVKVMRQVLRILEGLSPKKEEKVVLEACEKLTEMVAAEPDQVRELLTMHGVVPIMEMLEVDNRTILHALLKLVNMTVATGGSREKNAKFQQSMSLVGLIPAIIKFGGPQFPFEIRYEAANFVRQFCYNSDFTRKMFVACGGLPVLVGFLQEDYNASKRLVKNAIDCIRHVFDITSSPKNDFCRLFCKFGMLPPLVRTFVALSMDKESDDAAEYLRKVADVLHMFSQGDPVVKTHFAKPAVLDGMLRVLHTLPQEVLILILRSIRNITMDVNTLDLLESAGAIPALIPILSSSFPENVNQALLSLYYLCQIKASRQEQAAVAGIIPHLQRFIRTNHSLNQFAYPIIFLLGKTSARTRLELKKYGGVQFYLDVLKDSYWRERALEVLATWLQDDPHRVGFILNTTTNINRLFNVFKTTTKVVQIEKILPLYRRILTTSIRVNQAFGRSGFFIEELKGKLEKYANSNNIRISLLRILALIFYASQQPAKMIDDHKLMPVLERLSKDTGAVVVQDLARKLITKVQSQLASPATATGVAPTAAGAAAAALLGSPPPAVTTVSSPATSTTTISSSSSGAPAPAKGGAATVTAAPVPAGVVRSNGAAGYTSSSSAPGSPASLTPANSSLGLGLGLKSTTTATVTPTRPR